jgi:hypothetical protein
VNDPVKYGEMIKRLETCNYAVLDCIRHTLRSFNGFTCWIMVRTGSSDGSKPQTSDFQSE